MTGTAPVSKQNVPGYIRGFDVRTGKKLWTFHTIPRPGEFGHETSEADSWRYTDNTGAWAPLSGDEELGYVYIPVEIMPVPPPTQIADPVRWDRRFRLSFRNLGTSATGLLVSVGLQACAQDSKDYADQEPNLVQVRSNGGILYAEIAVGPMGQPHLWLEPESPEVESKTASANETEGAPVPKFGNLAAVGAVKGLTKRTTRAFRRPADVKNAVERDARPHERPCRCMKSIDQGNGRLPYPYPSARRTRRRDREFRAAHQKVGAHCNAMPNRNLQQGTDREPRRPHLLRRIRRE